MDVGLEDLDSDDHYGVSTTCIDNIHVELFQEKEHLRHK